MAMALGFCPALGTAGDRWPALLLRGGAAGLVREGGHGPTNRSPGVNLAVTLQG